MLKKDRIITLDIGSSGIKLAEFAATAGTEGAIELVNFAVGSIGLAPGNEEEIGGLKVTTKNGWFAARPSGTEDIYKLYAESFKGADHLGRLVQDAQDIVGKTLP